MQSDTLDERYAIKLCFKLGKNATKWYGMLQTAFRPSYMNRASVFQWHKSFKKGRESVRDDERCGRSKEVNTPELISQRARVKATILRFLREFRKRLMGRGQHSSNRVSSISNRTIHQSTTPSLSDYLTKMGIKTVPYPPYSPDIGACDFCLFPKLRGCRYETIEEMKKARTKVIDTLTQEDFHWASQKLLERYNKCTAAGGDYFEGD